jgi:exopolysaccharide production protein ExoQ
MRFGDGHILGGAAILFLPLAIFAPKGLAPLFAICCLALLINGWRNRTISIRSGAFRWMFLAFSAYCLISGFWSITPIESIKAMIPLALVFVGACLIVSATARLEGSDRNIFELGLVVGGLVGFGVLGVEIASDGFLTKPLNDIVGRIVHPGKGVDISLRPGLSVAAIFFWPWSLQLYRRHSRSIAFPLIAAAMAVLILSGAHAAILAAVCGLGFSVLVFVLKRKAALVFSTIAVIGIGIAPIAPNWLPDPLVTGENFPNLSHSADHRVIIWQVTAKHIFERPLIGHGFDTARALYGPEAKVINIFFPDMPERRWKNNSEPIPLHPHNMALQIWLELGFFGAALFAVFLVMLIRVVANRFADFEAQVVGFAMLFSTLVIASVSFGAWQGWWLSALAILSGFGSLVFGVSREIDR